MHEHARFVGNWTDRQKQMVGKAIEVVDERLKLRPVTPELEPAWICLYPGEGPLLYIAARFYLENVIIAESAEALRIRLMERAGAITTFAATGSAAEASADAAADHHEPPT